MQHYIPTQEEMTPSIRQHRLLSAEKIPHMAVFAARTICHSVPAIQRYLLSRGIRKTTARKLLHEVTLAWRQLGENNPRAYAPGAPRRKRGRK